jgi:hypothetical protein
MWFQVMLTDTAQHDVMKQNESNESKLWARDLLMLGRDCQVTDVLTVLSLSKDESCA